jgi:hypothetical protein
MQNDEAAWFIQAASSERGQSAGRSEPARALHNQELKQAWFGAISNPMSNLTMLSIVLTGAGLIRERDRQQV